MSHQGDHLSLLGVRRHQGVLEFPVWYVRGGTSTGLVIANEDAPDSQAEREELLRHVLGVPSTCQSGHNAQITGLGRGIPTSNKVFFVGHEHDETGKLRLTSTFAQLSADHPGVDWSVNCGNLTSSLPLWALDVGIIKRAEHPCIDIRNTNTNITITGRVEVDESHDIKSIEIPGVLGSFPAIDLFMHHPVGAKTGKLLPTGHARETINGVDVSCVDIAVPAVLIQARAVGKTGHEPINELASDTALMDRLADIRVEAGLRMGLAKPNGEAMSRAELAVSETVPKVCLVSEPEYPGSQLAARYFTPQKGHPSLAVTGGCCVAGACLVEGSVANELAHELPSIGSEYRELAVNIDNPAGTLDTIVVGRAGGGVLDIKSAAYSRNAQILMKGWVPLFNPSRALADSLLAKLG